MLGTRIEPKRASALTIAAVLALGVGLALAMAKGPAFVLIPLAPVLALLIVLHPTARLTFVVFGGLFTLTSSQELDATKLAYLVGMLLALGASLLSLRKRRDETGVNDALVRCSVVIFALLAISFVVGLAQGTELVSWLRDAASYLLVGSVPVFVADFSSSIPRPAVVRLFALAGVVSAISFSLLWAGPTHRHLVDLPIDRFVYPSFLFATGTFAFATSRALAGGKGGIRWLVLAGSIFAVLLITGTRTTLLLLVIPAVFLASKRFQTGRLRRLVLVAAAGLVVLVTAGYIVVVSSANTNALFGRFSSFGQLINDPTSDLSLEDRLGQTGAAWDAFLSSPVFGVGLGHDFTWVSFFGRPVTRFTIDTGVSFLAKFGLLGLAALLIVIRLIHKASASARSRQPDMAVVLTSYFILLLCYLFFGNPLEEKGFGLALLFLGVLLVN